MWCRNRDIDYVRGQVRKKKIKKNDIKIFNISKIKFI